MSGRKCPVCSNKKVLVGYNDLATTHPHLLEEWDYEFNDILPTEIVAGTIRKVWWKCAKSGHAWKSMVTNRTVSLANCPECGNANSSLVEKMFRDALQTSSQLVNVSTNSVKIPYPANVRGIATVDATAELINGTKVIFEFDGAYWHSDKGPNPESVNHDKEKTLYFLNEGFLVIRVRELPLKTLSIVHPKLIQIFYKKTHRHQFLSETIQDVDNILNSFR